MTVPIHITQRVQSHKGWHRNREVKHIVRIIQIGSTPIEEEQFVIALVPGYVVFYVHTEIIKAITADITNSVNPPNSSTLAIGISAFYRNTGWRGRIETSSAIVDIYLASCRAYAMVISVSKRADCQIIKSVVIEIQGNHRVAVI